MNISLVEKLRAAFNSHGVFPNEIKVKAFPGETIVVVEVSDGYARALEVSSEIDSLIENGFVTIRKVDDTRYNEGDDCAVGLGSSKVEELLNVLTSRSRTSESQPSLTYVNNAAGNISLISSKRNHLIFGRRGVGKTALLLESKRIMEDDGSIVIWNNIQVLRSLNLGNIFLTICLRVVEKIITAYELGGVKTQSFKSATQLYSRIESRFDSENMTGLDHVSDLIPLVHQVCNRFQAYINKPIYLFLDDFHYINPSDAPYLLDALHAISRDNDFWIKVSAIRHQTKWFIANPPVGLQSGHDVDIINLDVTLENPERAKKFLCDILKGYFEDSDIYPMSKIISSAALDRLVLASGGVPRDFLTLCSASIQTARQRPKAKNVGVQDVNNSAGSAAQIKLQELEDDAAATEGSSRRLVRNLNTVRDYLLNREKITFFRINFRDKELNPSRYYDLQGLTDLRMLHLINASISDQHDAGSRFEVYLLDLSQYSAQRLKQGIRVIDFENGHLILKKTRSQEDQIKGDSSLKLISILRKSPIFELNNFD